MNPVKALKSLKNRCIKVLEFPFVDKSYNFFQSSINISVEQFYRVKIPILHYYVKSTVNENKIWYCKVPEKALILYLIFYMNPDY